MERGVDEAPELIEEAPATLLASSPSGPFLIPENLPAEAAALADAAGQFMRGSVLPQADRLQEHPEGLMASLLRQAGALGLLSIDVPEKFGGLGIAKSVSVKIAEAVAVEPSFAVSHNVHTSVATLPILLFGAPQQKADLLPKLASGEWLGAYALSEAHAGSDAMAARTRAVPDGDGWRLTGEKMWITNAAFADLFTVFAKTDGGKLGAFLVERTAPGVSIGREENKLGLRGSSTCRLILDDVPVSTDRVLGVVGEGGKVALFTLNLGRFKIAAGSVGQGKRILNIATQYALERQAFGKPIAQHGLIRTKLAKMAARLYAAECSLYRVAGLLNEAFDGIDPTSEDSGTKLQAAAAMYGAECALVKVVCTEALDFCTDECLQIHGGYGFTEEFPAARAWRDARVNRIYEGTNEINRLNLAQLLFKRIDAGTLDLPVPKSAPPIHRAVGSMVQAIREPRQHAMYGQSMDARVADSLAAHFGWEAAFYRAGQLQGLASPARARAADYATVVIEAEASEIVARNQGEIAGLLGTWAPPERVEVMCARARRGVVEAENALGESVISAGGYPW